MAHIIAFGLPALLCVLWHSIAAHWPRIERYGLGGAAVLAGVGLAGMYSPPAWPAAYSYMLLAFAGAGAGTVIGHFRSPTEDAW